MEDGRAAPGDEGVEVGVALHRGARGDLLAAMRVHGRLGEDLADHLQALAHDAPVGGAGEVVGADHRGVEGVGASHGNVAGALGPQLADRAIEDVPLSEARRGLAREGMAQAAPGAPGDEMDLHLRRRCSGVGLQERPALVREAAEGALAEQRRLGEAAGRLVQPEVVPGLVGRPGPMGHGHVHVILQVLAHRLQLDERIDPHRL